jgi:hypothetical protein
MNLKVWGLNKTEIGTRSWSVFFSYNTPVGIIIDNSVYITDKFWSKTTSKHINWWLEGLEAEKKPQEFFDNFMERIN